MKRSSLSHYLVEGLRVFRKNGFKTILNPVSLVRKCIMVTRYKNSISFMKPLDYSTSDLVKNKELMRRFSSMKNIKVETVNWFIPYFEHPYGGIYTILRFANYFHTKGIKNRFVVCGESLASMAKIKDKIAGLFPNLSSEEITILRDNNLDTLPQADICIATSWASAHFALKFNKTNGKFYFIQDYEPLFYPAGTIYALAEATYRFGFYGITNTAGLHDMYTRDYEGIAEYFVPSVDKKIFYPSERKILKPSVENPFAIFFYARPDVPRNAFELGIAALQKIKKNYGERVKIYTAGSRWNPRIYDLENDIIDLGILPYEKTAVLYRKCDLGVVFMLTKHPSYLPFELMACGCLVLTNYNPATAWFLKDGVNCLLAEPTVTCVCEKTEMVMNNLNLRKQLISNGLDSIAQTSWNNEIEKIYRFICNH